jgi:hypothetical protein
MKKLIGLLLIIGMVLFIWGCNTPGGPGDGGGGEDVIYEWGSGMKTTLFEGSGDDKWIGQSFELSGATTITNGPVGSIDLYGEIILEADLFDEDDNPIEGKVNDLAQFSLLAVNSEWESNKIAKGDNISTGSTRGMPVSGKTDTPVYLLLEIHHWDDLPDGVTTLVGYINVRKLTFKPKTGDVVLDEMYNNGDYMDINGNAITFKNATGADAAAVFLFPAEWGGTETSHDALKNRTITFTYRIPAHTCVPSSPLLDGKTAAEHQLRIQAAHNKEDVYNGSSDGQQYINELEAATSFTIPANTLIDAAGSGGKGSPFILTSVRILNDGTTYTTGGNYIRCKSYTLIFDSITISD